GSTGEVSVTLELSNGSAIAPNDYTNDPIVVTFADGETTQTVSIPVVDDSIIEGTESVSLALNNPTGGATLGAQETAALSIADNDFAVPVNPIRIEAESIQDLDNFRVGRVGSASNKNVLDLRGVAANETGSATFNFEGASGAYDIIVGYFDEEDGFAQLEVAQGNTIIDSWVLDQSLGGNGAKAQTFTTRTVAEGYIVSAGDSFTITGVENSGEPVRVDYIEFVPRGEAPQPGRFSLGAASYEISESNSAAVPITIERTEGSQGEVSVTVQLTDGSAIAPDDYSSTPITVTFADGETTKTVTVPIVNDSLTEPVETLSIALTGLTNGATLGLQSTAEVTILDDDAAGRLSFEAATFEVNEDGTGNRQISIVRTNGTIGEVSATIQLTDGTATAPDDYSNTPLTVTFADGESVQNIVIPVIDDLETEGNETISLSLVDAQGGAVLGDQSTATVTIADSDLPGELNFSAPTYELQENGSGTAQVTVARTGGTTGAISAIVELTDGTALSPSDYNNTPITVNFADGEASQKITIPIIDDNINEENETVTLSLTNPSSGVLLGTQAAAELTIIDDEISTVTGELKTWHKITVDFTGDFYSETTGINPFRDLRLDVTFTNATTGEELVVPGYFAADGDAANTGATAGNIWRAHFSPPSEGEWSYEASFRTGDSIAASLNLNEGTSGGIIDGQNGTFFVEPTDKTGTDLRAKGLLKYVDGHYLQYTETEEYYLKSGLNSPENFLAYEDFDGTFDNSGGFLHEYEPHLNDWQIGDPTWQTDKGRSIIGAVNYAASEGLNSMHFLALTIEGDGQDTWPWISPNEGDRDRYDVSKLDQWQIVFDHMQEKGINLHLNTQEQENDQLINGGELGTERAIYYRELIARFGHHNGVTWNLGEENSNTVAQRESYADYFKAVDPYDHQVGVHTFPGKSIERVYGALLGYPTFETMSVQIPGNEQVHEFTLEWTERSRTAGRPWIVNIDEIEPGGSGLVADSVDPGHNDIRDDVLWGNLMANGGGVEWYFGGRDDKRIEDLRSRQNMYRQTRYAVDFFQSYLPFTEMENMDEITAAPSDYVLGKEGEVYAVYLPDGGTTSIDLPTGDYTISWYNSRTGGDLLAGSIAQIAGGEPMSFGQAPFEQNQDWAVLFQAVNSSGAAAVGNEFQGQPSSEL
ncbi:MAG: Calx-beta domain-containing protein, partial [Cyanobacteria bacterium J06598_1]